MTLSIVVGGQYGSEGKGAVAGRLAATSYEPVTAVRVAGPNAGHTVYGNCPQVGVCTSDYHLADGNLHPWKLRQVPVAAVTRPDAVLVIAAGSEIDETVLRAEVAALDAAGYDAGSRLRVDTSATIVELKHQQIEQGGLGDVLSGGGLVQRIGSTGKGVGAARADRAMRTAKTYGDGCWSYYRTAETLTDDLRIGRHVIIEGTQGYALGLHAGEYPWCTSSDCRAIDFMSMAGIPPQEADVWVVLRTWPIRVAGNSGPMHQEVSWDTVGQPPERTTVTNKIRRVGRWDAGLARASVAANGGDRCKIALTMVDYDLPFLAGKDGNYANWAASTGMNYGPGVDPLVLTEKYLSTVEADCGAHVRLVGTGPNTMLAR